MSIIALSLALAAAQPEEGVAWSHADGAPKSAAAEDMAIFDHYVGRFRSEDKVFDNSETTYFFVIDYRWYDRGKTIIAYSLERHIPSMDRIDRIGDGFYYLDRRDARIGVFGVFPDGRVGAGSMGEFDGESGARAVWVDAISPNGQPVEVHDAFSLVDADHWRNVTHIRREDGDWQEIGRDIYTRLPES